MTKREVMKNESYWLLVEYPEEDIEHAMKTLRERYRLGKVYSLEEAKDFISRVVVNFLFVEQGHTDSSADNSEQMYKRWTRNKVMLIEAYLYSKKPFFV